MFRPDNIPSSERLLQYRRPNQKINNRLQQFGIDSLWTEHRVELHLSGLIATVSHPDKQKIRTIGCFFENELHWNFEFRLLLFTVRRGQLKFDGARAQNRFRLSAKRKSPFKSAGGGGQFSRLLAAEVCASAIIMLDSRGSVKSTGYPIHSPVSPSLPLPCVTVCHHISTEVCLRLKPLSHVWFEVLEATKLYCTWSDNR